MLHIKNLTVTKSDGKQLFHNVSFHLSKQDKLAIIGEEGNGKSTLLKLIANCNTDYVTVSGEIISDEMIAYLPQQFEAGWEEQTILDYLLKEDPNTEIEIQMYNRLQEIEQIWLMMNGTISFLYREQPIQTLSGGEKVKIQLLKRMMNHATLLCLDEPSNDLDVSTLKWLENWIKSLEIPCIFISHDEYLLKACANHILHLEQVNRQSKCRHTFYKGNYGEYIKSRMANYEKEVQIAHNEKQAYQKKMNKMNDIANAVRSAQNNISRQLPYYAARLKSKMHTVNAMTKRLEETGYQKVDTPQDAITLFFDEQEPLPKQKQIITYQGNVEVDENCLIKNIDLSIYAREKIVFVGDNGCGKTTLLKKIYEILKERADIKVGYMPQNYLESVSEDITVLDVLCEKFDSEEISKARTLLGCLNFTAEEMDHTIKTLSDGQKAKLYLASFVMKGCNVLLLDEPTRNLSPLSQPVIHQLIQLFQGCVICVTHDRYLMKEVFESGYLIQDKLMKSVKIEELCIEND